MLFYIYSSKETLSFGVATIPDVNGNASMLHASHVMLSSLFKSKGFCNNLSQVTMDRPFLLPAMWRLEDSKTYLSRKQ
jgi:hypothetical protein